jgi:heat shock protein HslJ
MPFENTIWNLTHLGTEAVKVTSGTRRASLQFHADAERVSGSAGCNRLSGQYKRKANALSFTPLVTTRMVCPDAMDVESRFLMALGQVARCRILGSRLELYDAKGTLLARLEADS